MVRGVREAIRDSRAKKAYVVNLMTKWGETTGFSAKDFVGTVENYIGKGVLDYAIINTKRPSLQRLKHYEKESAEFVHANGMNSKPLPVLGDILRKRGFVRHDPEQLAKVLVSLL